MNSDDPVTTKDTFPSIIELLSIPVALMVFGIIDAYQKQHDQIQKKKDEMAGKKPKKESWKNKYIKSKQLQKIRSRDLTFLSYCLYLFIQFNSYGDFWLN